MDFKMNFNKILIQDVVHKRDYNQDAYRSTTDYSDDDDDDDESFISDLFSQSEIAQNTKTNKVNFDLTTPLEIDVTSSDLTDTINRNNSCIADNNCAVNKGSTFGQDSNFIYADSYIFDHLEQHYGGLDYGDKDGMDKLASALELLRETVEHNTAMQSEIVARFGSIGYGSSSKRHHHHHHHHHRRTNAGYSDDSQNRKNFDNFSHDERLMKRREKAVIEVRVVFIKIGEIDTLKEIYHADAFIQAKWREPKLDGKRLEDIKTSELERMWNPLLFIDNILTETKEQYWLTAMHSEKEESYIIERRKLKGVFLETLELNDFPLDVQDLTITISSERPDTEVDLVPDNLELSGINLQSFIDQQEWQLHEHVEVTKRVVTQEYTSSCRRHPCLSVTCRASRRPGYFYWNVFLVMFFITGLSFATFAVPPTRPENRLQLSFTLFLTSVAFKFVINQSLPRISYLTYMDKYVLMSLAILCIVSIWHSVITLITPVNIERDMRSHHPSSTSSNNNTSTGGSSNNNSSSSNNSNNSSSRYSSQPSVIDDLIKRIQQDPTKLKLLQIISNSSILRPVFREYIIKKQQQRKIKLQQLKLASDRRLNYSPYFSRASSFYTSTSSSYSFSSPPTPSSSNYQKQNIPRKQLSSSLSSSSSIPLSASSPPYSKTNNNPSFSPKFLKPSLTAEERQELRKKVIIARFQKKVERDVLISFALLYFFAHLIFIFWLYFGASRRRREMVEKDRQYRKLKKKQEQLSTQNALNAKTAAIQAAVTTATTTTTTTTTTNVEGHVAERTNKVIGAAVAE